MTSFNQTHCADELGLEIRKFSTLCPVIPGNVKSSPWVSIMVY